jgi:hypothetical protein
LGDVKHSHPWIQAPASISKDGKKKKTNGMLITFRNGHSRSSGISHQNSLYIETLQNYDELGYKAISCSWAQVFEQLDLAQLAKAESEGKDKDWYVRYGRKIADLSKILAPGLAAIPDELNLLHGGLAVIFNASIHLILQGKRC